MLFLPGNSTEAGSGAACRSCHVVAIPYPGRGHINPMMNLCRLLAGRDNLTITVIITEEWLELISPESSPPHPPSNIRLCSIPNVLPSERTRGDNYAEFFQAVLTKMEEPVQRLLHNLEQQVDVVVADSLLPWVVDLCKQRNIPAVSLWTESASVFLALYTFDCLDAADQLPADLSGDRALTYLPDVSTTHLANLLPNATALELLRAFARKFYWFRSANSVLMTSFEELEGSVNDNIRSEFAIPIYQVGPLIPRVLLPTSPSPNYLAWLDSHPKFSVLYVSLGSFLSISASQMEEIATGLVDSGVPFLWVARDYHRLDCAEKFEYSSGMIVPWCDQLRVLCHASVGGFLTHCGWNSTLEAVYAGVPMMTFPLFWDQKPNSKLVVEEWGIGFKLKDEEENVTRELVANKVKKLMGLDDEDNKLMRERAAKIKEICSEAVEFGGSSSHNLHQFLKQITRK